MQWRAASRKLMLTEKKEEFNDSPVWDYGTPLAWRHGTGVSRGNAFLQLGQRMGVNVSAVFIDGHADAINDDIACRRFHIRPEEQ
jgi:hypothetical protein